ADGCHGCGVGRVRRVRRSALGSRLAREARRVRRDCRFRPRPRRPLRAPGDPLLVNLVLVGTSYRLAPVELREKMAVAEERSGELAAELADFGYEAVCLSTCNR